MLTPFFMRRFLQWDKTSWGALRRLYCAAAMKSKPFVSLCGVLQFLKTRGRVRWRYRERVSLVQSYAICRDSRIDLWCGVLLKMFRKDDSADFYSLAKLHPSCAPAPPSTPPTASTLNADFSMVH